MDLRQEQLEFVSRRVAGESSIELATALLLIAFTAPRAYADVLVPAPTEESRQPVALPSFTPSTPGLKIEPELLIEAPPTAATGQFGTDLLPLLIQPIEAGVQLQCAGGPFFCDRHFRYYLEGGYIGLHVGSGDSKSFNMYSFEIGTRYFPFSFPLFFSAGVGYKHMGLSTNLSSFQLDNQTIATAATLDLATLYMVPSMGFNLSLGRRFYFGMDVGAQLPLIASGKMWLYNANNGQSSDTSPELQVESGTALNRVAALIVPKLTLFRLTYDLN